MKSCIICHKRPQRKPNQSYCVECNREYAKENYRQNKERYMLQAKKRDEQIDRLIVSRKSVPCADCGAQYPPYVMDFDHLEALGGKEFNIAAMRRRRMAISKIIEEMNKCEVVCSNCHRERTHRRNPSTRYQKILDEQRLAPGDF
jgi:hypothetical protein